MKMKWLSGAVLVLGLSGVVLADSPVIEWTTASGGNGHFYKLVNDGGTYDHAAAAASGQSYLGLPGQLAVFDNANYSAEFGFVFTSVYQPYTAGSDLIYWVGASNLNETFASPRTGWKWADGSSVPTSITSGWNIDVFEGEGYNGAGFYQTGSPTLWDYIADNRSGAANGYVVEFATIPEPAAMAPVVMVGALLVRRWR